jgi:hypothetical protein
MAKIRFIGSMSQVEPSRSMRNWPTVTGGLGNNVWATAALRNINGIGM